MGSGRETGREEGVDGGAEGGGGVSYCDIVVYLHAAMLMLLLLAVAAAAGVRSCSVVVQVSLVCSSSWCCRDPR